MKRQVQYSSRRVLVATAGLAAVSYVGTTACGQTSAGNLMGPIDGSGAMVSTGGIDGSGATVSAGGTGGPSGTGAFSSGNLMPYPTGGVGGACSDDAGGAAGEGGAGGDGEPCVLK
jgi:hypothetical protein